LKNYKNESSNIGFMKKILICLIYVWVSAVCTAHVQVGFARNKLYNIVPVNYSGKAVGYDPDSKRVVLSVSNDADKLQQWSVTNLSGSFRFINPFENKAIHATGDNTLGITENNGSDESQLWIIKKSGKFLQIYPSNSPDLILACQQKGRLVLVDKVKVLIPKCKKAVSSIFCHSNCCEEGIRRAAITAFCSKLSLPENCKCLTK
jgi:beta-galactosidase